jgi:probable rRNA maturation factor
MILLDPDLDPDPSPTAASAKQTVVPAPPREIRIPSVRTLARFLTAAQAAVRLRGQVTVLLTTDAAIRKLNRRFRGKNKATDVLSFPCEGPTRGTGAEQIAGDLAISVTTALEQAAEQGHSLSTEIKVLILHGLLHLAGYDHEADDGKMARRERVLRGRLGLPQGLIERAGGLNRAANRTAKHSSGAKAQIPFRAFSARSKTREEEANMGSCIPWSPKARDQGHPASVFLSTWAGRRPIETRLKSSPVTERSMIRAEQSVSSGAKAQIPFRAFSARSKTREEEANMGSSIPWSPKARDQGHPASVFLSTWVGRRPIETRLKSCPVTERSMIRAEESVSAGAKAQIPFRAFSARSKTREEEAKMGSCIPWSPKARDQGHPASVFLSIKAARP